VDTARALWLIYIGISTVEFLLLWLGGMGAFDAVCHTFGTMATGGFSTKNASIGYYGTYSQVVITVFMFLCGVNFSLYYQAFRRRFLFFRDAEFRFYSAILGIGVLVLLAGQFLTGGTGFWVSLRDSLFTGTSILTTTGYATANFEQWPYLSQVILVMMMLVGSSAGSTGGGMKVVRVLITLRWAWKNAIHSFRPHTVLPLRVGGVPVDRDIEEQVVGFTLLFIGWLVAGALVLAACGHDLVTSFTASVACIANIGPGLGLVGPTENYSSIHPAAKGFLSLLMIVGRLEVMSITALLAPGFWRR
jgi:trk system potassium uptake protein TrkH